MVYKALCPPTEHDIVKNSTTEMALKIFFVFLFTISVVQVSDMLLIVKLKMELSRNFIIMFSLIAYHVLETVCFLPVSSRLLLLLFVGPVTAISFLFREIFYNVASFWTVCCRM